MAGQRIKGQEVEIVLLQNGQAVDSLMNCKSLDITFKLEILQEGYLGETSDKYDSVFKGIEGSAEFHFSDSTPFAVTQAIIAKAQRREAGTTFNIKCTFHFPSGRRARAVLRAVEFGEIPFSVGGRSEFASVKLSFSCSEALILPT